MVKIADISKITKEKRKSLDKLVNLGKEILKKEDYSRGQCYYDACRNQINICLKGTAISFVADLNKSEIAIDFPEHFNTALKIAKAYEEYTKKAWTLNKNYS